MARRTVAYLTPLYFDESSCLGGGERYPLNLARGLVMASSGSYRVELVSFGRRPLRQEMAEGVTLRVITAAEPLANALDVVSWDLPEAIADADLVHIHQAYTRCAEVGLLVARQQGKPVCITDHGGFSSSLGQEIGAIELADRVVAYSDFGASFYRTTRPISVIKGGVDTLAFQPPGEAQAPERSFVLYVGRLLPHKGIDRLIEAMPADLPLVVCGRPYHDGFYRRLLELASTKKVQFITDADDVALASLYARAYATVLPSVYRDCYGNVYSVPELMGLTLLESMACGTPAICSRVGAMPEFIEHGRTGFVFDEPEELTGYLTRLAADPELVRSMGQEARRLTCERYDLRVIGGQLLEVYEELINTQREGAAAA